MLSGYMAGLGVCGYMHRRQVNTRKHKTELAYIDKGFFGFSAIESTNHRPSQDLTVQVSVTK
jgi:hypothetical protein